MNVNCILLKSACDWFMPFEKLLPLGHCLMGPTCKVCRLKEISMLKTLFYCNPKTWSNSWNLELVPVWGWKGRWQLSQEAPKHTIVFCRNCWAGLWARVRVMKRRKEEPPDQGSDTIGKYRRELRFCLLKSKQNLFQESSGLTWQFFLQENGCLMLLSKLAYIYTEMIFILVVLIHLSRLHSPHASVLFFLL